MCSSLCYGPALTRETFVDSLASWHPTQTAPQSLVDKKKTSIKYVQGVQVIQEDPKLVIYSKTPYLIAGGLEYVSLNRDFH
jgi:hypothetical protein